MKKAVLTVCWCLSAGLACEADPALRLPGRESDPADQEGYRLIARVVHISDTHVIDEESPARFAGAHELVSSAWRPQEAYSAQLLDGIIRAVNRIHTSGRSIDFLLHTGDACDNSQGNELTWLLAILDGGAVNPLTGPDDRPADQRPIPLLDPHAALTAQGLYRQGVHGAAASIPWYIVSGNHDRFAIGVFPIFQDAWGRRTAPLPLSQRPGVLLPTELDPLGWFAHGNVTPAKPGPPCFFELPRFVPPNPVRAYFDPREYLQAMFSTETGPAGHGFSASDAAAAWYSVAPVPGLRLIGLDTCLPAHRIEGFPYQDGAITEEEVAFLRTELDAARERGELVVVASHHPSASLWEGYGSVLIGSTFRELLGEYPNVVLHLAGHTHINRVKDRDSYLEIETCSTLDLPQEGRLIEIWRNDAERSTAIVYEMFSHLDDDLPALGEDPLRGLREQARSLAGGGFAARGKLSESTARSELLESDDHPAGGPADRQGLWYTH